MQIMVTIRPFEARDQDPAWALITQGLGEHFGFIDASRNPDILDIQANYTDKGHPFVVAEVGGRLIGTGALIVEERVSAQMVRISVHRDYRRQGIGTQLADICWKSPVSAACR